MYASFRCYSDEDLSKLGMNASSSLASAVHVVSSPLRALVLQDAATCRLQSELTRDGTSELRVASVLECIKSSREVLQSQMDQIVELKVRATFSFSHLN